MPEPGMLKVRMLARLREHPAAYARLRRAYLALWKLRAAVQDSLPASAGNLPRCMRLDPARIRQAGVGWSLAGGRVQGGDWDLSTVPLDGLDAFRASRAQIARATAAERALLAAQVAGAGNGVRVRIGRSGDLLCEGGTAAVAFAQLLHVGSIPVTLTARHAEWQRLRSQLRAYSSQSEGELYQPALHPDLADLPAAHDDLRFRLLCDHLPSRRGTVLDIGANLGYFCHKLEDEGFDCYGVERGALEFHFLERLRAAEGKRFHTIHADICDFTARTEFDMVLALNVFHHFLKTAAEHERLIRLLGRLRTPLLVFEPHDPAEEQMHGAYRNYAPDAFVEFIRAHGGFALARRIGEDAGDNRPIFLLQRAAD